MVGTSYSTPLVGLDAVVLDTETTGLDARTARVVQIGAVRMHGPKLLSHERFERLVNPGVPIPHETIAVHGIAEADVSTRPVFGGAAGVRGVPRRLDRDRPHDRLRHGRAEAGVRGCRQGLAPPARARRSHPGKLAAPTLAHHSLDRLCDWLKIEIDARHTAIGDAEATGRVFAALLPLLRQRNIRTLAEAEAATRVLAEQEARAAGGLLAELAGPAAEARARSCASTAIPIATACAR